MAQAHAKTFPGFIVTQIDKEWFREPETPLSHMDWPQTV